MKSQSEIRRTRDLLKALNQRDKERRARQQSASGYTPESRYGTRHEPISYMCGGRVNPTDLGRFPNLAAMQDLMGSGSVRSGEYR